MASGDGSTLELCGLLGEGGAGSVHRAVDRATGLTYALKLLSRTTPEGLERFRREAEITAALVHPNIVKIHTAGARDGQPFIAYELVEGAHPLDQALASEPVRRRVEMLRDVARALGYAHRRGVVHRDVKPDNVLVGADGRVRLTDFGIAKSDEYARLTRTGASVGTPSFMAPEQITGEREKIGPATDVWALGVMLHQALTGRLPFEADSLPELAARICRGLRESAASRATGVPRALEVVCQGALAPDPAARYPDGDAVAAALDAWLDGSSPSQPSGAGPGLRRRHRVAALVAAPLLVSALAVGAALLVPTGAPDAPDAPTEVVGAIPTQPSTPARPQRELGWGATLAQGGTFEVVQVARFAGPDGRDGEDSIELVFAQAPPVVGRETATMSATLRALAFRARMALQTIVYDSRAAKPIGFVPEFDQYLEALPGRAVTISLDLSSGSVSRVRGVPSFRHVGDSTLRQMIGLFANAFSDDALERTLHTAFAVFPARGTRLTADDGWSASGVVWVGSSFGVTVERPFRWRDPGTAASTVRLDRVRVVPVPGREEPTFDEVQDLRIETIVRVDGARVVSSEVTIEYRDPLDPEGRDRRVQQRWRPLVPE